MSLGVRRRSREDYRDKSNARSRDAPVFWLRIVALYPYLLVSAAPRSLREIVSASSASPAFTWCSERKLEAEPRGPRQCGMSMNIVDASRRFPDQAGPVEVIDVRHFGVEQIEHFQDEA